MSKNMSREKPPLTYFFARTVVMAARGIVLNFYTRNTTRTHNVRIYVDGVLAYSSPAILTGVLPIEFSVDVTNASIIAIQLNRTNTRDNSGVTRLAIVNGAFHR